MRKQLLTVALVVTALNLTIGVAYAAVCQSTGGARFCGSTCVATSGGGCQCTGGCTADERNWVGGAHNIAEAEEAYVY